MKKGFLLLTIILSAIFVGCGTQEVKVNETTNQVYSEATTEEAQENETKETEVVTEETDSEEVVKAVAGELKAVALKGPTAMGMVEMMNKSDNNQYENMDYQFTIVSSVDEVAPMLVKKEADLAAVPANLASVLYNNTEGQVQVLAINTLGVLYIVGTDDNITSVSDLKGKTVYASGKGATPEYALNYILQENELNAESDLTVEWKSEHTECLMALLENPGSVALLPQPFVTTAQMKNSDIKVLVDLNVEWEKVEAEKEEPSALLTGVIVGRKEYVEANPEAVAEFMKEYEASVAFVNENVAEAAELVGGYDIVPKEVAEKALPYCNITFVAGEEMKEKLSGYLKVLETQNPKSVGGKLPEDDFYYIGK